MKKISATILLILWCSAVLPIESVYALNSSASYGARTINAARAAYDVASKAITVPAAIYGPNAVKNAALAIPPARMAKIIMGIASILGSVAISYGIAQFGDYMAGKGYMPDINGNIKFKDYAPSTVLNPGDIVPYYEGVRLNGGTTDTYTFVYPTQESAYNATASKILAYGVSTTTSSSTSSGYGFATFAPPDDAQRAYNKTYLRGYYRTTTVPTGDGKYKQIICVYPYVQYESRYSTNVITRTPTPTEQAATETSIAADLTAGSDGAKGAAETSLMNAERAMNDANDPTRQSAAYPGIKSELDNSVTADQKAALDAAATSPDTNAENQTNSEAKINNQTTTNNTTTTNNVTNNSNTYNTTNNTTTGATIGYNATVPESTSETETALSPLPAYVEPEGKSFSGRFQTFVDGLKETSLFSIPGAFDNTVPAGSCTMSVEMGETFGGTHEFSMCGWSWLSVLKMVLLSIMSYVAVRIVVLKG